MRMSPLGPSRRTYALLAAVCLAASGPAQWWLVERGRRQHLRPPPNKIRLVELWPVLTGGFRGPVVAGMAYYAQQKEIDADVFTTLSTVRALIEVQPEFDHLWIYYSWVVAYNLSAVLSAPDDKYDFFINGIEFLESGVEKVANLYEGRKPYVNDRCPITRERVDASTAPDRVLVEFEGQKVALLDQVALTDWERLSEFEKGLKVEPVRSASREYKRKRATMLYMVGWTYYQKMSAGADAKTYFRPRYMKEKNKDPYAQAYRYLSRASAVDVPPYQVSFHVLKTAAVHCQMDWARTLADDPKTDIKTVAQAFNRAKKGWEDTLPFVEKDAVKWIQHSVREMDVVSEAMNLMATAEEKASVSDHAQARGAMAGARRLFEALRHDYPDGSYHNIYQTRLDSADDRVEGLLAGEILR